MKGLSRESRALIDAARDGDNPSANDRKRVRAALARKIAVGAAAGAVAATATHAAQAGTLAAGTAAGAGVAAAGAAGVAGAAAGTATAGAGTSIAAGAIATGFGAKLLVTVAIVGAVGAGTVTYSKHESAKRVAAATQVAAVASDPARGAGQVVKGVAPGAIGEVNTAPAVLAADSPNVVAPVPASAGGSLQTGAPPSPSPPVAVATIPSSIAPDLDAELALLQEAHAALRANEGARALRLLEEHSRRFPNGELGEESEAARVFALCELGRVSEARDVAGRFLREHPRSPLAQRVSRACDAEPSTF